MDNKLLTLFDGNTYKDKSSLSSLKTDIQVFIEGTDKLVFRGSNKVVVAGAEFTAHSHFHLPDATFITPSYDSELNLSVDPSLTPSSPNFVSDKCFLFAVGTGGTDDNNSNLVKTVDYKSRIAPSNLVPFMYLNNTEVAEFEAINKNYHGKLSNIGVGNAFTAFYFKDFESEPTIVQTVDGEPIAPGYDIYESGSTAETYIEINLKITKDECREFFANTAGGITTAGINTISLLTAEKYILNAGEGLYTYKNIRPLTKLNFPTESLVDTTKGLDIIYHIYY